MARRARHSTAEHFYHVINRAAGKQPLFTRPKDYREFLEILRKGLIRHPVRVIAYCVLSNHWHLLVGPTGTPVLSRLLHWVTTTHAVRFRRRSASAGSGPVYQGRFKGRVIEHADDLVAVCRYVERNALSANLVRRAQDWPWGSLAARRSEDPPIPLAGQAFLQSDAWLEHVNATFTYRERVDEDLDLGENETVTSPVPQTPKSVENRPVPEAVEKSADLAQAPGVGAEAGEECGGVFGRGDDDQAHAHVERAKHLRIVHLARALKPREQWRNRPTLPVN